ncbi:MAG: hypothetical protein GY810_12085 [Aureispira sp.]|nr:hypothetical protein [Aureispira sp.]
MNNIEPLDQPPQFKKKKNSKVLLLIIIGGLVLAMLAGFFFFRMQVEPPPEPVNEKPIIYLYPEQKTTINVQLNYRGTLTTTYPKYDLDKGWEVEAQPDGTLWDTKTEKEYYGLYWEGRAHWPFDLSTGFVVKGEETADFLDEKLAKLGLNRREANEFIVYWLPQLEQNEYNLIHFAQEAYQALAELNISPKPETLIRVFMVFEPLDNYINIPEQDLPTVERKGFTVVEWGGSKYPKRTNYE